MIIITKKNIRMQFAVMNMAKYELKITYFIH
jgi:hypothetical protein